LHPFQFIGQIFASGRGVARDCWGGSLTYLSENEVHMRDMMTISIHLLIHWENTWTPVDGVVKRRIL